MLDPEASLRESQDDEPECHPKQEFPSEKITPVSPLKIVVLEIPL
jgi:hypothetical protein